MVKNNIDRGVSSSSLNLNETYQIPIAVWAHNIIFIYVGRYGAGATNIFNKADLDNGFAASSSGGLIFPGGSSNIYWRITISSTGLVKLVGMNNTSNAPNVTVSGIF